MRPGQPGVATRLLSEGQPTEDALLPQEPAEAVEQQQGEEQDHLSGTLEPSKFRLGLNRLSAGLSTDKDPEEEKFIAHVLQEITLRDKLRVMGGGGRGAENACAGVL